jgi:diacylglycerol kinase (ATP)
MNETGVFLGLTILAALLISLFLNLFFEIYDFCERYFSRVLDGTKSNIYDENSVEEIWIRNRSSKYGNLILPPTCITKLDQTETRKKRNSFIVSMQNNTQRLMTRMYKATIGRNREEDLVLDWVLDINQFYLFEGVGSYSDHHLIQRTPLVCFINSKSGGQQGLYFQEQLQKLLNPYQIIDLSKYRNPVIVLKEFAKLPKIKVLIVGGDGTISWILDSLELVEEWNNNPESKPEIAILPIGTGNDLANELGWLEVTESTVLPKFLEKILKSQKCQLDRWNLTIQPLPKHFLTPSYISSIMNRKSRSDKTMKSEASSSKKQQMDLPVSSKTFQNYLGIGVDAQIVLQFHNLRNSNPGMFFHAYVNKFFYGIMGWKEIWNQTCEHLPKYVELFYQGKKVQLPEDTQGIVFLNISSFGGGSILWKEIKDETGENDDSHSNAPSPVPSKSHSDMFRSRDSSQEDSEYFVRTPGRFPSELHSREASDDGKPIFREEEVERESNVDSPGKSLELPGIFQPDDINGKANRPYPGLSRHNDDPFQSNQSFETSNFFIRKPFTPLGKRKKFQKVSFSDGLLEVVVVKSSFELAQVKLGITSCKKLIQGHEFELVVHQSVPIQIDGEPWIQKPCKFKISLMHNEEERKVVMCKPVPDEINIDILLETLEGIQKQQIITKFQSDKIIKEYIQRVQDN